jgi:hypothetical protein
MSRGIESATIGTRAGLSLVAFLAAAWLAAFGARALSPALPGSAIGIADLIRSTQFVAACVSQLVAAGGIALCVRLLGTVLPLPGLGVGLRLVTAPTTLAIVALVVSSATRPLEPELTFVLAAALPLSLLAPVPLLFSAQRTRRAAWVFLCVGLGSSLELLFLELGRRGLDLHGRWFSALPALLDVAAASVAVLNGARGRRLPLSLLAFALLATVPALFAASGSAHSATALEVLLYRSLEALNTPGIGLSGTIGHAIALVPFAASLVLLVESFRGDELCVALALCVLGSAGPGAPLSTLLGAGASLLAIRVFYVSFREGVTSPLGNAATSSG